MTAAPQRLPRRILMTADAVGGVWTYALDLAAGLAASGIETIFAVMGPAPTAAQRNTAAAIPGVRLFHGDFLLEWMPGAARDIVAAGDWLLDLERRCAPDLVHVNGYAHAALPWSAPCVIAAHSCVDSWWRAVWGTPAPREWDSYRTQVTAGLAAARAVVAPTAAFLATLRALYGSLPQARVIHNGRAATAGPGPVKQRIIFAAGRVWDEAKNIAVLESVTEFLGWPVFVAGDTRRPDGRIAPLRGVSCLGPLAADEVAAWMRRAAIFVSPARYEPFGLAVLEAAQAGCALVLSDIPTFRELWDGAAEFVPADDAGAIQRTLARLTGDPDRVSTLGAAARRQARRYGAEHMVGAYRALYAEVLATSAAPRCAPALAAHG